MRVFCRSFCVLAARTASALNIACRLPEKFRCGLNIVRGCTFGSLARGFCACGHKSSLPFLPCFGRQAVENPFRGRGPTRRAGSKLRRVLVRTPLSPIEASYHDAVGSTITFLNSASRSLVKRYRFRVHFPTGYGCQFQLSTFEHGIHANPFSAQFRQKSTFAIR